MSKKECKRLLRNLIDDPRAYYMEGDDDVPDTDPLGVAFSRG